MKNTDFTGFPGTLAGFLPKLALGLFLLILTFAVARLIKHRVTKAKSLARLDPSVAALVGNLIYVAALVIGIVTALQAWAIPITTIVAALGVSGLAVTLALQDVLRNFIAGFYILLEKPFNIGDRISLRDVNGEVLGIELRTTLLRTTSGAAVIVPNSVVMTEIVTNRSLGGLQPYVVTVSGGRDLLKAELHDYATHLTRQPGVSHIPEPEVVVESLEADKTSVRLRFWAEKEVTVLATVVDDLEHHLPQSTVSARAEV